jgi:hypothetical protein
MRKLAWAATLTVVLTYAAEPPQKVTYPIYSDKAVVFAPDCVPVQEQANWYWCPAKVHFLGIAQDTPEQIAEDRLRYQKQGLVRPDEPTR